MIELCAEGAYIHDLRKHLLDETYYEDQWRIKHHLNKDGNFYTTHGLGPISQYMNIGRGDIYDSLVSMSSREKSLSDAAKKISKPIHKNSMWGYEHHADKNQTRKNHHATIRCSHRKTLQ